MALKPVQVESLKQACIRKMEMMILSGEWKIGQRLSSERNLAEILQVSRPVVHQALLDLASKGLVSIKPRRGVFVNDYHTNGSLAILSSLLAFQQENIDPDFIHDLIAVRKVIEIETARLAAVHRSENQLQQLEAILEEEERTFEKDAGNLTELDFSFHVQIALASGNRMFPMILNSFRSVYTQLTGTFFSRYANNLPVQNVHKYHRTLLDKISRRDSSAAAAVMEEMLDEGATYLLDRENTYE